MKPSVSFNVSYDGRTDVLYITKRRDVAARGRQDKLGIVWRYDAEGRLIGATVMDFYERWFTNQSVLAEQLAARFHMPEPQAQVVINHALTLHDAH